MKKWYQVSVVAEVQAESESEAIAEFERDVANGMYDHDSYEVELLQKND